MSLEAYIERTLAVCARIAIERCAMDPKVFIRLAEEAIDWADFRASCAALAGEPRPTRTTTVAHSRRR